ncbi:MAG: ribosome recycling factor [Myxococcota bacterium]
MADDTRVVEEARQGMERSLESLHRELSRIRTGRANPALLENVMVDYYGTPTPLKALATLSAPEARLITVQPFDRGAMDAIERAILKADLGLTTVNDGKLLRVPVPELTEERRRELVKVVKKLGEDHKVGVRSARREAIAMLKELEKEHELSEDDSRRAQKKVQDLTNEYIGKVDTAVEVKEEDILQI